MAENVGGEVMPKLGNKQALAMTFCARFSAAIGTLILGIVVAREFGADGLGAYAIAQSYILGVAIVARFGAANSLTLYVGRSPYDVAVLRYLKWAVGISLPLSLAISLISYVFIDFLIDYYGGKNLGDIMPSFLFAAPAFTLAFVMSGMFKAIGRPARSALAENGVISIVTVALLFACMELYPKDIKFLGYCYALAAWLVLIWSVVSIMRWICTEYRAGVKEGLPSIQFGEYFKTATNFFLLGSTQLVQQVFSVMIAATYISTVEMGFFRAAERTAMLVGFVQIVINAVYPAKFAKAYYDGDLEKLKVMAVQSATIASALCLPFLMVCIFAPSFILSLFGKGFSEASTVLVILALAQGVNVALGSVSYLLQMTGHARQTRNAAFIASGLSLILYFLLGNYFGLIGIACAFAAAIVVQNILNAVLVRKTLGFWIFPSFI